MTTYCRPEAATAADLDALPALPRDEAGPVFRAPWEAQAFAMALELHRRGVFTWSEWAATLSAEIAAANARHEHDDGSRYYERWLAALETLATRKAVVGDAELAERIDAWDRAAHATPHGKPVVLPRA